MDWNVRKKVLNLRKQIFEILKKEQDSALELENIRGKENNYEIELIDEIIITINEVDEIWETVEEEFQEIDEMLYYDFNELTSLKDEIINNALELKNEIINKIYCNNDKLKQSHENIKTDIEVENNIVLLRGLIDATKSAASSLKNILNEYKNINFENIKPLIKNTYELYQKYEEIYDHNNFNNRENLDYDFYEEDDFNIEIDEQDEELEINKFKITSMPNYDLSLIDDIYVVVFSEINLEQRLLIGIMISDFYEYHKLNQDTYSKIEDKDKLELIEKIESSNLDEMINEFLQDANMGIFILDNYIYYNENFTTEEKLKNRNLLKTINKVNILKRYNKFINDSLIDDTVYNVFIKTINNFIRTFTEDLVSEFIFTSTDDSLGCLYKYFKSDFLPKSFDKLLPNELNDIKIKHLKELQLKFILTDYITKQIKNDDENIKSILDLPASNIYKIFFENELMLKALLNDYIKDEFEPIERDLTKEQKQKIYKLNKLTILDN